MKIFSENVCAVVVTCECFDFSGIYEPHEDLQKFGARIFVLKKKKFHAIMKLSDDRWVLAELGDRLVFSNFIMKILFSNPSTSLSPPYFGWTSEDHAVRVNMNIPTFNLVYEEFLKDPSSSSTTTTLGTGRFYQNRSEIANDEEDKTSMVIGLPGTKSRHLSGLRVFRVKIDFASTDYSWGVPQLDEDRRLVGSPPVSSPIGRINGSCPINSMKIIEGDSIVAISGKIVSADELLCFETYGKQGSLLVDFARQESISRRLMPPPTARVVGEDIVIFWEKNEYSRGYMIAASDDGGANWMPVGEKGKVERLSRVGYIFPGSCGLVTVSEGLSRNKEFLFSVACLLKGKKIVVSPFSRSSKVVFFRGKISRFETVSEKTDNSDDTPKEEVDDEEYSWDERNQKEDENVCHQNHFLLPLEFEELYTMPIILEENQEISISNFHEYFLPTSSLGIEKFEIHLEIGVKIISLSKDPNSLVSLWNKNQSDRNMRLIAGDMIIGINDERNFRKINQMLQTMSSPRTESEISSFHIRRALVVEDSKHSRNFQVLRNDGLFGNSRRLLNSLVRCNTRNFFLFKHFGPKWLRDETRGLPRWLSFSENETSMKIQAVKEIQNSLVTEDLEASRIIIHELTEVENAMFSEILEVSQKNFQAQKFRREKGTLRNSIKQIEKEDWRLLDSANELLEISRNIQDVDAELYIMGMIGKWEEDKRTALATEEFEVYLKSFSNKLDLSVLENIEKETRFKNIDKKKMVQAKKRCNFQTLKQKLRHEISHAKETGKIENLEICVLQLKNSIEGDSGIFDEENGELEEAEKFLRICWAREEIARFIEHLLATRPLTTFRDFQVVSEKIKTAETLAGHDFRFIQTFVSEKFKNNCAAANLGLKQAMKSRNASEIIICLEVFNSLGITVSEENMSKANQIIQESHKIDFLNSQLNRIIRDFSKIDFPEIQNVISQVKSFTKETAVEFPLLQEANILFETSLAISRLRWSMENDFQNEVGITERLLVCDQIIFKYFCDSSENNRKFPDSFSIVVRSAKEFVRQKQVIRRQNDVKADPEMIKLLERAISSTDGDFLKYEYLKNALKICGDLVPKTHEIFNKAEDQLEQLKKRLFPPMA